METRLLKADARGAVEETARLEEQGAQLAALGERMDEVQSLKAQIEELQRLSMPTQVAERVQ